MPADCPHTLEYFVRDAHKALPEPVDRTFTFRNQEFRGCRFSQPEGEGHCSHVAIVTPGQAASTVPNPQTKSKTNPSIPPSGLELGQTQAPGGSEFLDGDMFFFLRDDHLLFCSTGLVINRLADYLRLLFEKSGLPECASMFNLTKVAAVDKAQMIQNGVSELILDCGLYKATVEHEKRTLHKRIFGGLMDELWAFFSKDPELNAYTDSENLTVELSISFNRAHKGGEMGQRRIQSLAQQAVDDDDPEGFKIRTFNGETLTANDVCLRKKVRIERNGKTVYYEPVWRCMREYYEELRDKGFLEQ